MKAAAHNPGPRHLPALLQVVRERGLQAHPSWMRKAMELYETTLVRASSPWS